LELVLQSDLQELQVLQQHFVQLVVRVQAVLEQLVLVELELLEQPVLQVLVALALLEQPVLQLEPLAQEFLA
jgi:hypothetical protein